VGSGIDHIPVNEEKCDLVKVAPGRWLIYEGAS